MRGVACAVLAVALTALAAGAGKQKQSQSSYAVVAGTVFRETGLALAGARVTLKVEGDEKQHRKPKNQEMATNSRGEFAFRLPPAETRCTITVKAPGYQPQQKPVRVAGDERIDVFFRMEPASK